MRASTNGTNGRLTRQVAHALECGCGASGARNPGSLVVRHLSLPIRDRCVRRQVADLGQCAKGVPHVSATSPSGWYVTDGQVRQDSQVCR